MRLQFGVREHEGRVLKAMQRVGRAVNPARMKHGAARERRPHGRQHDNATAQTDDEAQLFAEHNCQRSTKHPATAAFRDQLTNGVMMMRLADQNSTTCLLGEAQVPTARPKTNPSPSFVPRLRKQRRKSGSL